MVKIAALVLALVVVAQPQRPGTPEFPGVEYPPQDDLIKDREWNGLVAKQASQRLATAPEDPETLRLLARARNHDGILRALRLIVDKHPERIAAAFLALGDASRDFRGDNEATRRRAAEFAGIVADAQKRLADLPREDAAAAERALMFLGPDPPLGQKAYAARLAAFVERYRGTDTALLAEVDLIVTSNPTSERKFEALAAFVKTHAGTTAAAKALYLEGFHWHTSNSIGELEPRGGDPIHRFMRLLPIFRELESGRYAPSEWTDKALSLMISFFIPKDSQMAASSVEQFLDAYREFIESHFLRGVEYLDHSGIPYLISSTIADLYERKGERVAGVERFLGDLERAGRDPAAVALLRASFYMRRLDGQSPAEYELMQKKARDALAAAHGRGQGIFSRKVLATLASLEFDMGEHRKARVLFREYATSSPDSSWTWLAWLRAGRCEDELGNSGAAASAYLEAARRRPDLPLAIVLGHEYAARSYEAAGDFEKALASHQRALEGWDGTFGLEYRGLRRPMTRADLFAMTDDPGVLRKETLSARIADLKQALQVQGGSLLERGRWLIQNQQFDEGRAQLKRFLTQYPKSSAVPVARELMHRAHLERILQLLDVEAPAANPVLARQDLEGLTREPHDVAVAFAKVVRATLSWIDGDAATAEKLMAEALSEWHARQNLGQLLPGLETDVAEIRRAVFLPHGGGIYGKAGWNAFSWTDAAPAFAVVNADVIIRRPDGEPTRLTLQHTYPTPIKVLFVDSQQVALLQRIIMKLGGTRRRQPQAIMETPNQPVGDSMQILRLWNKFFHARPGHWGGWETETYPVIREIQFTDIARTKASARVTIGYSGATVELEKEDGRWVAKRLTDRWVT